MAPEVALCKNYGLSADVYSFSILLWEIISLKIPFAGFDVSDILLASSAQLLVSTQNQPIANDLISDFVFFHLSIPPISISLSCRLRGTQRKLWMGGSDQSYPSLGLFSSVNCSNHVGHLFHLKGPHFRVSAICFEESYLP